MILSLLLLCVLLCGVAVFALNEVQGAQENVAVDEASSTALLENVRNRLRARGRDHWCGWNDNSDWSYCRDCVMCPPQCAATSHGCTN